MVSPFAPFANFEATFQVASGGLVPDSKGNLRPGKATIAVTALMEQKRDPRKEPRPGVDPSAIYLSGYLVSPAPLPSLITEESKCSCTWNGIQGEFFLEFTGRDPYLKALNITLVDEIKGYFQPKNFVVEGDPYVPPVPIDPPQSGDTITVPFSWGDATPKLLWLAPAGTTIFTAQIVVQVPFNGIGAALSIGEAGVGDRLMRADQNDPSFVAEYETNPAHTYPAATQLYLTINPGEGATQGAGYVLLEV